MENSKSAATEVLCGYKELARFKGLSCTYAGGFRPGTNIFAAKSTYGTLWIYDLDTLSLFRKITYTSLGAQDDLHLNATGADKMAELVSQQLFPTAEPLTGEEGFDLSSPPSVIYETEVSGKAISNPHKGFVMTAY